MQVRDGNAVTPPKPLNPSPTPSVWYLGGMSDRALAVVLIQTALGGLGLPGDSSRAAEVLAD